MTSQTRTTKQIEIWIAVNENGDYEIAPDRDDAIDQLNDNYGGSQRRLVKLNATVSLPTQVECDVIVPDDAGETVTVEAA